MLKFNAIVKTVFISMFILGNVWARTVSSSECENKDPELENQSLIEKYSLKSEDNMLLHLAVFVTMHALVSKAQAEGNPEVANFVGKATFGNNWAVHFEIAKRMHESNGYGDMPNKLMDTACNIIQCELLKKAPSGDVRNFLYTSFDKKMATHTMNRGVGVAGAPSFNNRTTQLGDGPQVVVFGGKDTKEV